MGKRVIELLVSDLSGTELDAGQGETIEFSYRGKDYTIDVTDTEAEKFDKAMEKYLNAATKLGGRRSAGSSSRRSGGSGRSKEELADARAWLKQNGHKVSDRGRIKQELLDIYDAR